MIEYARYSLLMIPIASAIAVLFGFKWMADIRRGRQVLNDSILALSTYLKSSLSVFLKRQLMLTGAAALMMMLITFVLQYFQMNHALLIYFIFWGVLWATVIGCIVLSRSSMVVAHFLQQALQDPEGWKKNTYKFGWLLVLIFFGFLTFNLGIALRAVEYVTTHNIFGMSGRIMGYAHLVGIWGEDVLNNPVFETMRHREITLILLAYSFGVLVQTFLVKMTTQTMSKSSQLASEHLEYQYPGLGADDLRSPLSMAHHISEYAYRIWGHLSSMINVYLLVLLSALSVSFVAYKTSDAIENNLISFPMTVCTLGLLGGALASCFYTESLLKQWGISSAVIAFFSWVAWVMGSVPFYAVAIVWITLCVGILLYRIQQREPQMEGLVAQHLSHLIKTWVSFFVILSWMGVVFYIAHGPEHILTGMAGIALGASTLSALGMVNIAASLRHNFVKLTLANARILRVEEEMPESIQPFLVQLRKNKESGTFNRVILITLSALALFFVFLESTRYWILEAGPAVLEHLRISFEHLTHLPLSDSHCAVLLSHISFSEIDFLLGISPTRILFLLGVFCSVFVATGVGILWVYRVAKIEKQAVLAAVEQLEKSPEIIEGQVLPSYQEPIQKMTSQAFRASFVFGILLSLLVPLIGRIIGFGGLTGLLMGMIFLTLLTGLFTCVRGSEGEDCKEALAHDLIGLATQALLLFAFLFGAELVRLGCGF